MEPSIKRPIANRSTDLNSSIETLKGQRVCVETKTKSSRIQYFGELLGLQEGQKDPSVEIVVVKTERFQREGLACGWQEDPCAETGKRSISRATIKRIDRWLAEAQGKGDVSSEDCPPAWFNQAGTFD